MGMFGKKIDISQGSNHDVTRVSSEGVSKEERLKLEKENKKLIDIFKAFDLDGDGSLNQLELAKAMDEFTSMDKDKKDGKLSKKELKEGAENLNNHYKTKGVNIDGKGLKAFLKAVSNLTQNDEKVSTLDVLTNDSIQNVKSDDYPVQNIEESSAAEPDPPAPAEEKPQTKQPPALNDYTVQEGESYTDLIIRSLKAQGIENPTDEQVKEAKEKFNENNPGAVRKAKNGVEFLLVGAKVKLEGKLEDKNNSADQIKKYNEKHTAPPPAVKRVNKDKDGKVTSSTEFTYDANGNEIKRVNKDKDGKVKSSSESTYDANGYRTKTVYKDKDGKVESSYEYTYDANGNITKRVDKDKDGKVTSSLEATYDANGNETKTVYKDKDGKVTSSWEATYDANGNKTKEIYKDKDGKEISYDEWLKL